MEEAAITFPSGWLNLDSLSIIRLAALLLSLVICVYLLQIPRKSLATLFLAGVLLGAFLFNAASFFETARIDIPETSDMLEEEESVLAECPVSPML